MSQLVSDYRDSRKGKSVYLKVVPDNLIANEWLILDLLNGNIVVDYGFSTRREALIAAGIIQ